MSEQQIITLLEKAAACTISVEEQQELSAHLKKMEGPSYAALMLQYEQIVLSQGMPEEPDDQLYEQIRSRIVALENEPRRFWWGTYAAAAAILILILAGGAFWFMNRPGDHNTNALAEQEYLAAPGGNKAVLTLADGTEILLDSANVGSLAQQGGTNIMKLDSGRLAYEGGSNGSATVQYNTLRIPRGGQFQLTLPDGTKVWLNSLSSLRYPVAFHGKERLVELQGQGYFEVAQQAERPFRVKVGDMQVNVLGTRFDIMAYDDEHTVQTTLVDGAVQVMQDGNAKLLVPGQQAIRHNSTRTLTVAKVDVEKAIAWKNGFFEFDDATLPAICRQITRWYDIDITDDTKEETGLFWGRVSKNMPLSGVLKMLESNGVRYRIEGRKVILFHGK